MGFLDKFAKVVQTVSKSVEAVGTHAYRKAKKPLRQYMAPERAEKLLDKQLKVPRRAPMNVPKIDFPKENIDAAKAMAEERMRKNNDLIKNMEKMKISSHDPGGSSHVESQHPKPKSRTSQPSFSHETPRGAIRLTDIIELLHNHELKPYEWTAEELAEHFQLRYSDVKDLLEHFQLLHSRDLISK